MASQHQARLEEEARCRKVAHAPAHEMQSSAEKRAWPARGWFSDFGALGKIGDLLQALLAVSEKDVVGKVRWKSRRR